MQPRKRRFLFIFFLVIAILYLFFHALAQAKGVLAPIFLAILVAMMLVPVANFLEKKGIGKGWAAFLSDLIFVIFILGVMWAVGMEVQKITKQWSSIQDRLSSQFEQVESFIEKNSGFSIENPFSQGQRRDQQDLSQGGQQEGQQGKQDSNLSQQNQQTGQKEAQKSGISQQNQQRGQQEKQGGVGGKMFAAKQWLTKILSKFFSFLATILLISVYIFFMLLYRKKFWQAVLRYVPEEQQKKGKIILGEIIQDARQYLVGNLILVATLTVVYSIGFSISGMKSPFTTAFLAAILSLVPYVGTALGGIIAVGLAYITTGKTSTVLIVVATYAVAQFIESYFIEPYLVGNRVKVNPLFTIFAVTIGAAVWGVIGMIVFLPLFAFIKVVADHVPMLHPIGYTIGNEDAGEGGGLVEKIKKKMKS